MTISCDVVFYKNLGLELKEIRGMDAATPEQHGKLFSEKLVELEHQQELLARRMEKLRYHEGVENIGRIEKTQIYQESDIDTACIVSF